MIDTWVGVSKSGKTRRLYALVSRYGYIHEHSVSEYPSECWKWGEDDFGLSKQGMIRRGYTVQRCEIRLKGGAS